MIDTPFETHGRITSLAEEGAFLDQLAQQRGTTVTVIGHTVQGHPIRRVSIGRWGAPAVLLLGLQHGNEPAGREAALRLARDLVFDSETWGDFLVDHAVHIIPTINADKLDQTRNNAAGENINRDYARLDTPEARAVSPQVQIPGVRLVVDMHEQWIDETHVYLGVQGNVAIAPQLMATGEALKNHLAAWLPTKGLSWAQYFYSTNPGTMRNHAAFMGKCAILLETSATDQSLGVRLNQHVTTASGVLEWFTDNLDAITTAIADGAAWQIAQGQARAEFRLAPAEGTLSPAPSYYTITQAQFDRIAANRHAAGIVAEPHRYGWKIPMAQPARCMIPYLMDADATWTDADGFSGPVIEAIRDEPPEWLEPIEGVAWGPLRSGGYDVDVVAVDVVVDGELCEVWRPD